MITGSCRKVTNLKKIVHIVAEKLILGVNKISAHVTKWQKDWKLGVPICPIVRI